MREGDPAPKTWLRGAARGKLALLEPLARAIRPHAAVEADPQRVGASPAIDGGAALRVGDHGVVARAGGDRVRAVAAGADRVVAVVAGDRVAARAALQEVVAGAAGDVVGAAAAEHLVVAVAGVDRVRAAGRPAGQAVAPQHVVAGPAEQGVRARAAGEGGG